MSFDLSSTNKFHLFSKHLKNHKTQFVKITKNQKGTISKGLGHPQMPTTKCTVSTVSSMNSLKSAIPEAVPLMMTNNLNKYYDSGTQHSQQLWSMSHLNINENVAYKLNKKKFNKKKRNNYEFSEQRCNYERIAQHQLEQQLHRPGSSKQAIRYKILNSKFSSCFLDKDQNQHDLIKTSIKISDEISGDFKALFKFRMQNSKDCFSERHQQELLLLPEQIESDNTILTFNNSTTSDNNQMDLYKLNWQIDKKLKNNENKSLPITASFSTIPYVIRQRMLREQLGNDLPERITIVSATDKSTALAYQPMH